MSILSLEAARGGGGRAWQRERVGAEGGRVAKGCEPDCMNASQEYFGLHRFSIMRSSASVSVWEAKGQSALDARPAAAERTH